jgi:hypothetical protein
VPSSSTEAISGSARSSFRSSVENSPAYPLMMSNSWVTLLEVEAILRWMELRWAERETPSLRVTMYLSGVAFATFETVRSGEGTANAGRRRVKRAKNCLYMLKACVIKRRGVLGKERRCETETREKARSLGAEPVPSCIYMSFCHTVAGGVFGVESLSFQMRKHEEKVQR